MLLDVKGYKHDKTTSVCKHNLAEAIINDKTLALIALGWIFVYPPQNATGAQDKSMMLDPTANYSVGHHYSSAYKTVNTNKKPRQAHFVF